MIKITIDDREVQKLLKDLSGRVKDMRPVMQKIAGIMHDAVEENFKEEGRPNMPLNRSHINLPCRSFFLSVLDTAS